jgi:hypothetical protein
MVVKLLVSEVGIPLATPGRILRYFQVWLLLKIAPRYLFDIVIHILSLET